MFDRIRPPRPARALGLAAALVLSSPIASAQATVWVVDLANAPGAHFTEIQPAVDAAADGDVVLVRGRFGQRYGSVVIADKALFLVGEPDTSGPFPVLAPPATADIRVVDLAAGKTVVLRGLSPASELPFGAPPAVEVRDCAGLVFLEAVGMTREDGPNLALPDPATLRVIGSQAVTVVSSSAVGERGIEFSEGAPGGRLSDSRVFLLGASVRGGLGASSSLFAPGFLTAPTDGGTGLVVEGGSLYAFGGSLAGGDGGRGALDLALGCIPSRDGGTGLAIHAADVVLQGTDVLGGAGGLAPGAGCAAGQDGAELVLQSGSLSKPFGNAREALASSPVREDEDLLVQVRGEPGDLTFLFAGLGLADPVLGPAFDGAFLLGGLFLQQALGPVPASGEILQTFPVPELGLGIDAVTVALQPVLVDATTLRPTLGPPSSVVLLDRDL